MKIEHLPRAWLYENKSGSMVLHTDPTLVRFESDMRSATEYPDAHSMTPLYDQAALDAAVAAERERCSRICEETWVEPGDLQTCNCQEAADKIRKA